MPDQATLDAIEQDVTWNFYEKALGLHSRLQLARKLLELKGSWLTVMFLYQDYDRRAGKYRPPRIAFVRYDKRKSKKIEGTFYFVKKSSFNLSFDQAGVAMPQAEEWVKDAERLADEAYRNPPPIWVPPAEREGADQSTPGPSAAAPESAAGPSEAAGSPGDTA